MLFSFRTLALFHYLPAGMVSVLKYVVFLSYVYIIMCSTLSAFMVFPLLLVFINLIIICFGIICVCVCVCVCEIIIPEFH